MSSREEVSCVRSFEDGDVKIIESYLNDELNLVTLMDYRERTVSELYSVRTEGVRFIFTVEEDCLRLSRIFASTDVGGYALDFRSSIFGGNTKTFERRGLLDSAAFSLLESEYPDLWVNTRRVRDRIRMLIS